MDLHQLQVTYQTNEDRVLLRVSFRAEDGTLEEIRAWLTRRIVKSLWPGILRSLDSLVKMTQPQAAHASSEILSMEYQASVTEIKASGNFDIPFEAAADRYPMGEAPILISSFKFQVDTQEPVRIAFSGAEDEKLEIGFTQKAMHGFCKLLQEAVRNAEWDLTLQMPSFAQQEAMPSPRRLLN
ncbi:MAG: hypothetical protein HYS18_13960 [Burkholderiales bacterium]|nr:hypothetical protein [Burkholderiales bacterium]